MDKGAHFHRCDFQVHTPRDRRWNGPGVITPEERIAFAQTFVSACRTKGIQAVGITDHHDMAFIPYIRNAAAIETDSAGNALPATEQLAVFPGMELTLAVPCQALLLFDANFPDGLFTLALTALAITPSNAEEQYTAQTIRLSINSLQQLHEELDRHPSLKGRYIVLPNVSEGGKSTLLRSGHGEHYKAMPCVGGISMDLLVNSGLAISAF